MLSLLPLLLAQPFECDAAHANKGLVGIRTWPYGAVIAWDYDGSGPAGATDHIIPALRSWSELTGLHFVRRTDQVDYINFTNGSVNSSALGRVGGKQNVTIKDWNWSVVAHEVGHAIGLQHEHQRADRDDYVEIRLENVQPGRESQFEVRAGLVRGPYDFDSIMHYWEKAWSTNGQPTIVALPPNEDEQGTMGRAFRPSGNDIATVVSFYGPPEKVFDADFDGDVDDWDLRSFESCARGPGLEHWFDECVIFDYDDDGDVDQSDFGVLQRCLGLGIEACS